MQPIKTELFSDRKASIYKRIRTKPYACSEDYTLMLMKLISSWTHDCMSASNEKQYHTILCSQCFAQNETQNNILSCDNFILI